MPALNAAGASAPVLGQAEKKLIVEKLTGDSSFINNLIKADSAARARGSQFTLQLGTARIVRSAIEHSGILTVLDHAPTREEALDSL